MQDFSSYMNAHETKELLRFITCGSVDDGKSTLIGRMLYESQMIYDDELATLATDSKKFGTTGDDLDFALLVDGLSSEREQGITIDVAYRFFSTEKRNFIVADTPGHEQYTRNMATGASTAQLAIVMIDARKGILTQTRRHSFIVSLLGIKQIILAVNKMDIVNYDKSIFDKIKEDYLELAASINITNVQAIPLSALRGDNIMATSVNTPWYQGATLFRCLEDAKIDAPLTSEFCMPVQWVNRPHQDFRGFSGRIASGAVSLGQRVRVLPSKKEATIDRIVTYDGDLSIASSGASITVTLNDAIDISRGDVIVDAASTCSIADQFETVLLWMAVHPLVAGRQYIFKLASTTAYCTANKPNYRIDINTMEYLLAEELALNEIGCCVLTLDRVIAYEPYEKNHDLGAFILIDRMTNETVAAGLINFALKRSTNIYPQQLLVDKAMRMNIKMQKPFVLWLTGLSGAGKSTIANLIEAELNARGKHTMLLDGDNIRLGLSRDLGFTESDRAENIRRVAEVSKLMLEAGLITLVSFISPFEAEREMARNLVGPEKFIEIFVDVPLAVAEQRDTKGLYKKAREGKIPNFTGIGSPYEKPRAPDLHLDTEKDSLAQSVEKVLDFLRIVGVIN